MGHLGVFVDIYLCSVFCEQQHGRNHQERATILIYIKYNIRWHQNCIQYINKSCYNNVCLFIWTAVLKA